MSDPHELSAPRDPGSYGRPRRSGLGFWALIAFGLACLAIGYGAARFGPQLYPDKPGVGVSAEAPPATISPLVGPIPPPLSQGLAQSEPEPVATGEISRRLEALEGDRARLASAAASALAAAALVEASQTSRPFAEEVKGLAAAPPDLDLRALEADAARGAPSRAALAASFPDYAARAASAARAPGDEAGVLARIAYALSRVVALRRVGEVPGDSSDAVLARAERQVEDGDLVAALATLEPLPPGARDALAPWRERAERRAKIDRSIAAIRAQALEQLSHLARGGAAGTP